MMNDNKVLGLDIGGTNIRCGLVDGQYRLHSFEMDSSVDMFNRTMGEIDVLAAYVRNYCVRHCDGSLPSAVSIGFPSTLNKEKTILLSTPNLSGFDNLNVVDLLSEKLGIPVFINRDVNLLLINDIHVNGLDNEDIVIGCYIGTGLGNSISIKGEILSGRNGVAGELGHVPIYGGTRTCGCGNIGCMETIASGRYLEELTRQHFPGESISDVFTKHHNSEVIINFIEGLSIPVSMEINLFDPDCVILGGGVLQMKDFPFEFMLETIGRHARKPLPYDNLKIIISSQNQESGVIGAGMYAYSRMQKGIKYDSTRFRPCRTHTQASDY
jgi:allose kinase